VAEANSAKAASFQGLGDLPGGDFESFAFDVSADGSTVVGRSSSIAEVYDSSEDDYLQSEVIEAFRWTKEGGMEGLGLLGGDFSSAYGVSADGSVVVGDNYDRTTFRWTKESGMQFGPMSNVYGISADGSTVVGRERKNGSFVASRWTQEGGTQELGYLTDDEFYSEATAVSADGSIVVGTDISSVYNAFRWTQDEGMQGLGDLPGGDFESFASGVSADGSTIVGGSSSANGLEAFRWTQEGGIEGLGDLPGGSFQSRAFDVSADGSTIVGNSTSTNGNEAFIWDSENQMRSLQEILTNDFALDLTGWKLSNATAISDDGFTIVGNGINPNGNSEGWIATVHAEPVPEPSLLLATGITFGFGTLFKKRKNKVS
jgi:probable HAF family extracellular repeat protein